MWDSSSDTRYLVLPQRPAGTDGLSERDLAALVTRDAMIGTGVVSVTGGVSTSTDILGADANGPAALPRRNGELVFAAPWESRAFGAAVAMSQSGIYRFDELRDLLIEEIGHWERTHGSDGRRLELLRALAGGAGTSSGAAQPARHRRDRGAHAHDRSASGRTSTATRLIDGTTAGHQRPSP